MTSADIEYAVNLTTVFVFARMHTEAIVLRLDGRTAEQRLVDAIAERRYAAVLAVSYVGQVQRPAEIGGKRPQFRVALNASTEHRAIRTAYLVAVLTLPERQRAHILVFTQMDETVVWILASVHLVRALRCVVLSVH